MSCKRISFLATGVIALTALLSSCQQEVDETLHQEEVTDSIYLQKVVYLDTTQAVGSDTAFVYQYSYDAKKRVVQMIETEYGAGPLMPYTSKFTYSGNDTLPLTMTSISGNDSTVSYFYYTNQFIRTDSAIHFTSGVQTGVSIAYYSAISGGQYLYRYYSNGAIMDSVIYTRSYMNGNLVSGMDSTWQSGAYQNKYTFQDMFDTKKNPYRRLQRWYNGYYTNILSGETEEGSANNVTSRSYTFTPGGPGSLSISYDYDAATGYPKVGRVNSTGDVNKVIYSYIKL